MGDHAQPRRLKRPMSVRGLAKATGLSPATAHRIMNGSKITVDNARKAVRFMEECPCCGKETDDD